MGRLKFKVQCSAARSDEKSPMEFHKHYEAALPLSAGKTIENRHF